MDYALAKALKDAGFPQTGNGTRVPPPHKIVARRDDFAYVPTLEELIEACAPSDNMSLHFDVFGAYCAIRKGREEATGETPTEAIARLWLALNCK